MSDTTPWCCFIYDEGQKALQMGNLTRGDERAILDRFTCRKPAKWEIYGANWLDNYTHACDAHKAELTTPGDTVQPLP